MRIIVGAQVQVERKRKKAKNDNDNDLLIAMDHVAWMQVLGGTKQLVEDVLLVNFLQDVAPFDDIVQIRVCTRPVK